MAVLAAVSILFGVHLANEGLMPYPDWLDRLVFVIRAAMLSVLIFFSLIVALIVYFAPAILAWRKHKRVRRIIGVFNFFFGWTFFGWLILLAWGLTPDKETEASA